MEKQKSFRFWIVLVSGVLILSIGVITLLVMLQKKHDDSDDSLDGNKNVTAGVSATEIPQPLSKYHVGDSVILGKYEQDGNSENGAEDIEWIVLDVNGLKVLLVSKYALESMPFNTVSGETSWETSSVRTWLNGGFIEDAFSETERGYLISSSIENKDYYIGITETGILKANNTGKGLKEITAHTTGGAITIDKVFLLSVDEANAYFASAEERAILFTNAAREHFLSYCVEEAKAYGLTDEKMIIDNIESWEQEHGTGSCFWWLRSPGLSSTCCSIVDNSGETYNSQNVESKEGGVRPALWVVLPEEE